MMTRGECKTRVSVAENAKIAARPERKKSQPQRHGKFRFFTPTPRKILKNYLSPLWGLYSQNSRNELQEVRFPAFAVMGVWKSRIFFPI